ncbi:MAG: ABC transporter permease [Spirochaetes bacterium]|nr:ABC transporter permease [Spirochaetota bacterium]
MNELLGSIGRRVIGVFSFYTGLISLLYYSIATHFSKRTRGKKIVYNIAIQQIYFTGVQALGIIGLIAFAFGAIIGLVVFQIAVGLSPTAKDYAGFIMVMSLVDVLGPLITAIIVIARSGTAMATEIANMVVRNEMLALESMAINTLNYIVLPRVVGMVVSIVCLVVFFCVVAVVTVMGLAWFVDPANEFGKTAALFFAEMDFFKVLGIVVKAVFFGCGISLICIINGFKVLMYPGGAPVSGIRGVVGSLQYVVVVGGILTVLFLL